MANRLNGKVALITGALGGLGAAQARMMAAEGARVFSWAMQLRKAANIAPGMIMM